MNSSNPLSESDGNATFSPGLAATLGGIERLKYIIAPPVFLSPLALQLFLELAQVRRPWPQPVGEKAAVLTGDDAIRRQLRPSQEGAPALSTRRAGGVRRQLGASPGAQITSAAQALSQSGGDFSAALAGSLGRH